MLWRGVPAPLEAVAALCLVLPLVAAVMLSATGRMMLAHAVSAAAMTGLTVCAALASGGLASPVLAWLVVAPIEAMLLGSRRAAVVAGLIAFAGAVATAMLGGLGEATWPSEIAVPTYTLALMIYLAALGVAHSKFESARRLALRDHEAQEHSLLQVIDDLVTWHDPNGQVLKANRAAMRLLGVRASDLSGRGLFSHVHVPDRPAFLKAISDAATSDTPVAVEFRLHRRPDPEQGQSAALRQPVIWAEMRAHRISPGSEGANPHAVIAVTRDVSARKQQAEGMEEALAAAERADESKGRFLATVSHELRTPLNAIIGFSELLGGDQAIAADEARRTEYAKIIHDSGHHLLEVVNTLLDMSKIEAGSFAFTPEPFDFAALTRSCCDLIQLKADQEAVLLERSIAANLPEIVADRRACRQILTNLLSNAVKFTPAQGRITVSVVREFDRLAIVIADTGIGIDAGDLSKIGNPFFQAANPYQRQHDGTGLGLSVVRGLLGLHRGSLSIESGRGEGTTVTVTLPLDCRTGLPHGRPVPVQTVVRSAAHWPVLAAKSA
jgi:cell cycle sensor histidine kinase DivJ